MIDYTTIDAVIQALRSKKPAITNPDAGYLGTLVTAASRDIDHYVTGVADGTSDGYFGLEAVVDELLPARFDNHGVLNLWPHKPRILSVEALAWRASPGDPWPAPLTAQQLASLILKGPQVQSYVDGAWPSTRYPLWNGWRGGWPRMGGWPQPAEVFVRVSYTGGLAADPASLPGDLALIATDLTIRYYREERAGIADAIGVESLGVMTYTKQMPSRIARQLEPYRRRAGWNYLVA